MRVYAIAFSLFTLVLVACINARYIVYIAMMACRAVELTRPRAFSQDQMAELISDGADQSLLDYRTRGQLISVGGGESFYVEPLHDCVGFDLVRLRDTRGLVAHTGRFVNAVGVGRPLLTDIVDRERSKSNNSVVAIYPSASDVERLVSEVLVSASKDQVVQVQYATSPNNL